MAFCFFSLPWSASDSLTAISACRHRTPLVSSLYPFSNTVPLTSVFLHRLHRCGRSIGNVASARMIDSAIVCSTTERLAASHRQLIRNPSTTTRHDQAKKTSLSENAKSLDVANFSIIPLRHPPAHPERHLPFLQIEKCGGPRVVALPPPRL